MHKWQNFLASIVIIDYRRFISSVCSSGQWSIFGTCSMKNGNDSKRIWKREKYSLHVYTEYLICMKKEVSETKVSFCDVYVFVLIFKIDRMRKTYVCNSKKNIQFCNWYKIQDCFIDNTIVKCFVNFTAFWKTGIIKCTAD